MICFDVLFFRETINPTLGKQVLCGVLAVAIFSSLSGCGSKEKKPGQALVKVNDEEITSLQLNDELGRANIKPEQQEAAAKQLLESLIDQQLVLAEAIRNKVDRTPAVMQAIERAKKQIIAQSYLQGTTSKISKPAKTEINDYFEKHPELFTQRKELVMRVLAIASTDMSNELKSFMDTAKSLDDVAAWLTKHNVHFLKGRGSRNSASLPPEMSQKLLSSPKGTLFIVNEGGRSMLVSLDDVKDSPVSIKEAEPQIEKYLMEKKIKEAIDAEVKLLRSQAKIEYLNGQAPVADKPKGEPAAEGKAKGGT